MQPRKTQIYSKPIIPSNTQIKFQDIQQLYCMQNFFDFLVTLCQLVDDTLVKFWPQQLQWHKTMYTKTNVIVKNSTSHHHNAYQAICDFTTFLASRNGDNIVNLEKLAVFASYQQHKTHNNSVHIPPSIYKLLPPCFKK